MSEVTQTQQAYDKAAGTYDATRYRKKTRQRAGRMEEDFVRRWLEPGSRVLEVGSGTGRITSVILEVAESVVAVDISAEMLNVLASKLGDPKNLILVQSSLLDLDRTLASHDFDAVVSLRVIPHLRDTATALRTVLGCVKPGGQAIVDFWNNQSLVGIGRKLMGHKHEIPTFHHTHDQMLRLLQEMNLEVRHELPLWLHPRVGRVSLDGMNNTFVKKYAYSSVFDTRKKG